MENTRDWTKWSVVTPRKRKGKQPVQVQLDSDKGYNGDIFNAFYRHRVEDGYRRSDDISARIGMEYVNEYIKGEKKNQYQLMLLILPQRLL